MPPRETENDSYSSVGAQSCPLSIPPVMHMQYVIYEMHDHGNDVCLIAICLSCG